MAANTPQCIFIHQRLVQLLLGAIMRMLIQAVHSLIDSLPVMCRHVQLLQSVDDVERLPPGPAVVLASLPSLEGGPARELLTRWATGERNLVVVPGRPLVRPCGSRQHFATSPATAALLGWFDYWGYWERTCKVVPSMRSCIHGAQLQLGSIAPWML
jgi:Beta-Casp domain